MPEAKVPLDPELVVEHHFGDAGSVRWLYLPEEKAHMVICRGEQQITDNPELAARYFGVQFENLAKRAIRNGLFS